MSTGVHLTRLCVEGRERPLGVDERNPRFSWVLEPGDHEVEPLRARVDVRRAADGTVVWSSGDVGGDVLRAAPAESPAWESLTEYAWTVEVDALVDGASGTLRSESTFETGLLREVDWAGAAWIGGAAADDSSPAPLLRAEVEVPAGIRRARLIVAAGGIAAVTVNGVAPGDEVLSVGLTDFAERVPYVVHDVTDAVAAGRTAIAISLGRGFFGMTTENAWNWHRAPWHGEPRVRALLVLEHGGGSLRLGTGAGFRTTRGGTRADSYYEGELFDASLEPAGWRLGGFDDTGWADAVIVPGPAGRLRARPFPGIRVAETLEPRSIVPLGADSFVVDFGRQVAGWLQVHLPSAPPGHELTFRSTERLIDGVPDVRSEHSDGELQLDRLVSAGEPLQWEPAFGYKGFQYVEVTGWPDADPSAGLRARVAHSDVARTAWFSSSDDRLVWMHEAAVATMLNNLHHIPTDTPVYEKNGWTGDAALGAQMMLRDLDTVALLEDWVESIAESRDPDGRPALIVPNPGWHWANHIQAPPWHSAYWTIPWRIFEATGDDRTLRRHAEGIFRYLRLEHGLLVDGLADSGLGDYLAPDSSGNPDEDRRVCATVAVFDGTLVAASMAALLGDTASEREFRARAAELRSAFRREFFDPAGGVVRDSIAGYRQAHNVLALASGLLAPAEARRAAAALALDIDERRGGHLWVGALGTRRALPVLSTSGHAATAFRAATAPGFPGWLNWRAQGATTMWEHWDDQRSRNHYFFGTVDDWLFENVAGLRIDEPGYRSVRIRPDHLAQVTDASVELETVRGRLTVAWEHDGNDGVLRMDLPHGTTALVELPGAAPVRTTGRRELPIGDTLDSSA